MIPGACRDVPVTSVMPPTLRGAKGLALVAVTFASLQTL
jgi:hypothetical protein